jgi:hypothetical protein
MNPANGVPHAIMDHKPEGQNVIPIYIISHTIKEPPDKLHLGKTTRLRITGIIKSTYCDCGEP